MRSCKPACNSLLPFAVKGASGARVQSVDIMMIRKGTDLLDEGLRPLKAALVVLWRHAGACMLNIAGNAGETAGYGVVVCVTRPAIAPKGVGRPTTPIGVGHPAPPAGVAAGLLVALATGGGVAIAPSDLTLLAADTESAVSAGPVSCTNLLSMYSGGFAQGKTELLS